MFDLNCSINLSFRNSEFKIKDEKMIIRLEKNIIFFFKSTFFININIKNMPITAYILFDLSPVKIIDKTIMKAIVNKK